MMQYKGYIGLVEFDDDADIFFGKVASRDCPPGTVPQAFHRDLPAGAGFKLPDTVIKLAICGNLRIIIRSKEKDIRR